MVQPVPENYPSVTPYLCVEGAAEAIEFYKKAFGAKERMRLPLPDGKLAHAELEIRGSVFMLSDAMPDWGAHSPKHFGGSPVSFMLYVEDCDAAMKQATAAGATEERPLEDQFYGDRTGTVKDPYGHQWTLASHVKDMTPEEMMAAMKETMGG